jgi:hypothetical protein
MDVSARVVAVAALLGASTAASASTVTFDFSYTFGDGQYVTGDFTGTTTNGGQSVTNIGNIQVQLDGTAFAPVVVGGVTLGNATLQADTWNPSTASFSDTIPVTIYSNGSLNNFIFSDVDAATNTSPDYYFGYLNDATNGLYEAAAANFLQNQQATDSPGNAADWTLTEVQTPASADGPIPLWALSALGASLVSIASRRMAKKTA